MQTLSVAGIKHMFSLDIELQSSGHRVRSGSKVHEQPLCKRLEWALCTTRRQMGQTERASRAIEDMLRAHEGAAQTEWHQHLLAAKFAYNNSVQASTGFTPFYHERAAPTHPLALLNHKQPRIRVQSPPA